MSRMTQSLSRIALLALGLATAASQVVAQEGTGVIEGRVTNAQSGEPVAGALVQVEGTGLETRTGPGGRYRLADVPSGPRLIRVRTIGFAPARSTVIVPAGGAVTRDLTLAASPLMIEGVVVTADALGRARGELGTATVIDREAIRNQVAASLEGVLELLPGVPLAPPGLDGVRQIPLRSVPTSTGTGTNAATPAGPSPADLASFGTLIVLDGVPLSNNANLQGLGSRGELSLPTSAGGGIDLRNVPATTLERVEVIRGVPSVRYGDLTQGAVIVDTRAGVVDAELTGRYDGRTAEASTVGGWDLFGDQTATVTLNVAHTRIAPGLRDDAALRFSGQVLHRLPIGQVGGGRPRLLLDSRVDVFQLFEDVPERPEVASRSARQVRDRGIRVTERMQIALGAQSSLEVTGALARAQQRSFVQSLRLRSAMPFTDRLTEGRSLGRFVQGEYLARVEVDGDPWFAYARVELGTRRSALGLAHALTLGTELRREWNAGPGRQFDIEFPPQSTFNGVEGFDRPRAYDDILPMAASAVYLDDRIRFPLPAGMVVEAQAGLRWDVLHRGRHWFTAARDHVLQPRVNLELAPIPWVRFRGAWGRTAKLPTLGQLYPAPQYFDVVNVNWFTTEPEERLAVLTTFIRDPANEALGFSRGRKAEAGFEVLLGNTGGVVAVTAFDERVTGGVGIRAEPDWLVREHFALADSTRGTGRPPEIVEPAQFTDTVPVLVHRPAHNLTLDTRGIEVTAFLPEVRPLRTRLDVQAAWVGTQFFQGDPDFGTRTTFSAFQLDPDAPRTPYWESIVRTGDRAIVTYRLVHHQPAAGFVLTAVLQHYVRERRRNEGGADTLAFAGYMTRDGTLHPVPRERRGDPEFADLRQPRAGVLVDPRITPADWLFSLQVMKTLPLGGRLSFYAFNAFDREGRFGGPGVTPRAFAPLRFGFDVTMPIRGIVRGGP